MSTHGYNMISTVGSCCEKHIGSFREVQLKLNLLQQTVDHAQVHLSGAPEEMFRELFCSTEKFSWGGNIYRTDQKMLHT